MASTTPLQQTAGSPAYPAVVPPEYKPAPAVDPAFQQASHTTPLQQEVPQPVPTSSGAPSSTPGPAPDEQKVINALINLYTSKDMKVKDAVVDEFYAPSATFVDNAVHVSGHRNIKVQFRALGKMFKSVKFEPTSSSLQQQDGQHVVKIQNVQQYAWGPAVITLNVDSTLQFDKAGKIQKHSDVWQGQWSNFGFCKRIVGSTSSMFMRLVRV